LVKILEKANRFIEKVKIFIKFMLVFIYSFLDIWPY